MDIEQNEHWPLKPFLVKIQEPNRPLENNTLLLGSIGLTWPYVTLCHRIPIQLSQEKCPGDGTTCHRERGLGQGPLPTHVVSPELHYGWVSKWQWTVTLPSRTLLSVCFFHLTGNTNNLFPSRRAGWDRLKVGFSVFQGRGSVSCRQTGFVLKRLLPDPINTWGNEPESIGLFGSQDLHCGDSEVTGQQEGHPPGTPHPWLGSWTAWELPERCCPLGRTPEGLTSQVWGAARPLGFSKITPQLTLMCRWVSKPLPWSPVFKAAWPLNPIPFKKCFLFFFS